MQHQIGDLPPELLGKISSTLDAESKAAFRLTCRSWSDIGLAATTSACPDGTSDFALAARMLSLTDLRVRFRKLTRSSKYISVDRLIAYLSEVCPP